MGAAALIISGILFFTGGTILGVWAGAEKVRNSVLRSQKICVEAWDAGLEKEKCWKLVEEKPGL